MNRQMCYQVCCSWSWLPDWLAGGWLAKTNVILGYDDTRLLHWHVISLLLQLALVAIAHISLSQRVGQTGLKATTLLCDNYTSYGACCMLSRSYPAALTWLLMWRPLEKHVCASKIECALESAQRKQTLQSFRTSSFVIRNNASHQLTEMGSTILCIYRVGLIGHRSHPLAILR